MNKISRTNKKHEANIPTKKISGRGLVFIGTIILLLTVSFVSYLYLFNNSFAEKTNDLKQEKIDLTKDSIMQEQVDTTKVDKHPVLQNHNIHSDF